MRKLHMNFIFRESLQFTSIYILKDQLNGYAFIWFTTVFDNKSIQSRMQKIKTDNTEFLNKAGPYFNKLLKFYEIK